jgi:rhamnosyltransferase
VPASRALAGVVVYDPDLAALVRLIAAVSRDVDSVAIYANTRLPAGLDLWLRQAAGRAELVILQPGLNRGLGAAYDAFLELAQDRESEFLLLLDQDSQPAPGMVPQLAAAHRRLACAGERVAVVGPQPVDPDGRDMRLSPLPCTPQGLAAAPLRRSRFVMSSGSLIRVDAARAIGGFRSDYFIDAIDIEWCMRAAARGFSVFVAEHVRMGHRLGRGVVRLPFGLLLTDQPPKRLYTYVRNQLSMMRLKHVPLAHKLKTAITMPIRMAAYLKRNRFSRECRAALFNGVVDGLRDRLGPPDRAFMPPLGGLALRLPHWDRGRLARPVTQSAGA